MIGEKAQPETSITASELHRRRLTAGPAEIIDVRTPSEFVAVHVPGSRLVSLGGLDADAFCRERAGRSGPVYVLCQTGGRARKAAEKLRAAGLSECVLVEGGVEAWIAAGLPVERGVSAGLSLIRQVHIAVGFFSLAGAGLALTVHPLFALVPLVTGAGLLFAGLTGICGLALLLAKMPWNRSPQCCASSRCETQSKASP